MFGETNKKRSLKTDCTLILDFSCEKTFSKPIINIPLIHQCNGIIEWKEVSKGTFLLFSFDFVTLKLNCKI